MNRPILSADIDGVIWFDYECKDCHGTGLYRGMLERGGAAVVCNKCNGKGKCTFKAKPFTGRKKAEGVTRVFAESYNCVTSEDITTEEGKVLTFSQWGCTYQEWLDGKTPVPLKGLVCPYQHDRDEIPIETKCNDGLGGWGSRISDCRYYTDKAKCWVEYEAKKNGC